jgi:hypothetical protein
MDAVLWKHGKIINLAGAFGADYIANLLRQQRMRRAVQPPLRFQNPQLNELATDTCVVNTNIT